MKSGQLTRPQQSKKILLLAILLFAAIFCVVFLIARYAGRIKTTHVDTKNKFADIIKTSPTPSPSPSPSPTPKPLTFSEMNALYGPCVHLPVLMYHRVQTEESAKADKQTSISVFTDYFGKQMQYLKDKGYNVVSMQSLVNFFDNGTAIPAKSVLITFDDGYEDFFTDAYPILTKFGFPATVFVPTGLVNNPNYLTWDQITSTSNILYANHTWSHKNVMVSTSDMKYEISTADTQLSDHKLNLPKVFAYPYGLDTGASEKYLSSLGYEAAFTTAPGGILCAKQKFALPRIRIGNAPLSSYGF